MHARYSTKNGNTTVNIPLIKHIVGTLIALLQVTDSEYDTATEHAHHIVSQCIHPDPNFDVLSEKIALLIAEVAKLNAWNSVEVQDAMAKLNAEAERHKNRYAEQSISSN